ncbi:hypothetical protein KVF89_14440 [Nocardioides carbamazepini]|uniref:hypothetical protein n=1 Tax=Nocardioides carbamazepini TaxID=2854259 RepID=UPI002149E9D3|nr:hypothetical protein [Nocardioides carbamazepini]MCR1783735.1 hypothetical protein [Nocardioides carbamazepini]
MKRLLVRRCAVGLTLGALAATGLAGVSSPAHAAVSDAWLVASASVHNDGSNPDCVASVTGDSPDSIAWSDNGVTVTQSYAESGTVTAPGGDVSTLGASGSTSVTATPIGAGPATITASSNLSASAVPSVPATVCQGHATASGEVDGEFVLPQPMWATITVTGSGTGTAEVGGSINLSLADGAIYVQAAKRSTGTMTALIPAGNVGFDFDSWADAYAHQPTHRAGSFTMTTKVDLQPVGAASTASGKGAGYAQFGARDCATGNVAAAITKKAKKKAKQVLITVNGAKVAKFKGKKLKKRTLVLPAAPASAAEVVATITLKNGKKVTVTRSYLACS